MSPQWDTDTRGQNREEDESYYDEYDWDGLSCADFAGLFGHGHGMRDIEDLTMLSGLAAQSSRVEDSTISGSPSDDPQADDEQSDESFEETVEEILDENSEEYAEMGSVDSELDE